MGRRLRLGGAFLLVAVLAFWLGVISMALYVRQAEVPTTSPLAQATAPPTTIVVPSPTVVVEPSVTRTAPMTTSESPVAALPTAVVATADPRATRTTLPLSATTELSATMQLVDLLNAARAGDGCDVALIWQDDLAAVAQGHAEDMATNEFIDHVSSDGSTYTERLDAAGMEYVRRGENIAAGYIDPLAVLEQWMDEPDDGPHRLNVLNCFYEHAGIGLAFRDDGYPYWVLNLIQPPE